MNRFPSRGCDYVVVSSRAKMPGSCMGGNSYRRVAVIRVDPGAEPKMISDRARGVQQVIKTWERQFSGRTWACAYGRAHDAAVDLAAELAVRRACQDPTVDAEPDRSPSEEL